MTSMTPLSRVNKVEQSEYLTRLELKLHTKYMVKESPQ